MGINIMEGLLRDIFVHFVMRIPVKTVEEILHPVHYVSHLCRIAIGLSCCCLAALLHGWRWRGRRWEALSADSGYLEEGHSRV